MNYEDGVIEDLETSDLVVDAIYAHGSAGIGGDNSLSAGWQIEKSVAVKTTIHPCDSFSKISQVTSSDVFNSTMTDAES